AAQQGPPGRRIVAAIAQRQVPERALLEPRDRSDVAFELRPARARPLRTPRLFADLGRRLHAVGFHVAVARHGLEALGPAVVGFDGLLVQTVVADLGEVLAPEVIVEEVPGGDLARG